MIDNKFRRMMVSYPESVREAVLKPQQVEFAKYVIASPKPVLATQVAEHFGVSVAHAGVILRALTQKGYLRRLCVNQSTGGVEFEYRAAFDLVEAPAK